MKSVLCLTVLVAFVAVINGALVPMQEEQAKPAFNENLFANAKQSLNLASAQKVEETPEKAAFNENLLVRARQIAGEQMLKQRVNDVINRMKLRKAMMKQDKTQSNGLHFLCKPCKTVFTDVVEELESVEEITAPVLKQMIDDACKKFLGSVPFVEKACDKLGETAIDDLLKWLLAEEDKINAERSCIFLHMC